MAIREFHKLAWISAIARNNGLVAQVLLQRGVQLAFYTLQFQSLLELPKEVKLIVDPAQFGEEICIVLGG